MQKKIEVCVKARNECSNGDFIICARTDAKGVEGIQATIDRSKAYIDAGADMIFPEGLSSLEEF
jgi:methylisocitrate lyase